jgi:hypothetical protein
LTDSSEELAEKKRKGDVTTREILEKEEDSSRDIHRSEEAKREGGNLQAI